MARANAHSLGAGSHETGPRLQQRRVPKEAVITEGSPDGLAWHGHGMAWYGMERRGMAWNGMEWFGLDMERHGIGMEWYGIDME